MIELHHISKSFTERNWRSLFFRQPRIINTLRDVSFTVGKGEIMGLLGPNGAGKTTIIKILATLITPDSGRSSITGLDTCQSPHLIREKIGLVSANDRTFYWRLTGRDNLDFFASLYNLQGAVKTRRVAEVIELTDMTAKANFRFMSYSTGQKQRIAIARAMLAQPDILLLDEATASLDPIAARNLLNFTKKTLAADHKKTILWCTHNLTEAEELCNRLTIIHHGQALHSDTPAAIKLLLGHDQRYRLVVNILHPLLTSQHDFTLQPSSISETGDTTFTCTFSRPRDQIPNLLKTLCDNGIHIHECSQIIEPLETAFTHLVSAQHPSTPPSARGSQP